MAISLNIGKCSLLGNYRENNEDSIDVRQFPDLTVAVVADGMGGQQAGEVASKRAIEIVPRELRKNLAPNLNPDAVKGSPSGPSFRQTKKSWPWAPSIKT